MSQTVNANADKSNWDAVFTYCAELKRDKPGACNILRDIVQRHANNVHSISLSDLKEIYTYQRNEPFPIEGDVQFTRRCLLLIIPGVVATTDGLKYYYCSNDVED